MSQKRILSPQRYGWLPAATLLVLAALACGVPGEIAPEPTAVPPEAPAPQESKDPVQSGDTFELQINNQSSETICFVQISSAANKEWGEDWLGDEVIVPNSTFTFTDLSGTYDLRALDCDTNEMGLQEKITFSEDLVWTFTDAGSQTSGSAGSAGPSGVSQGGETVQLEVINQSSETICYVYISPSSQEDLGPDWLGENGIIDARSTYTFDVPPGAYDLFAVDCNGDLLGVQGNVDLSSSRTWTFSNTGSQTGGSSGYCGDEICTDAELAANNCPFDCGGWESYCGDGTCDSGEDVSSCAEDCGRCGDGLCTVFENSGNCPGDCGGSGGGYCGDDFCSDAEFAADNCPFDCGGWESYCGNGTCESGENVSSCAEDCGRCGDGLCTVFENSGNCPGDCGSPQNSSVPCGDGICEPYVEDEFSCPADCG